MAKWTRDRIIRDILRRESEGLPLISSTAEDGVDHAMYQAASRIFGSWRNAVMAAGLPGSRSRSNAEWTPARIRKLIRSLSRRKQPLRAKELRNKYGSFLQATRRHFGSWSKAVAASGVDPHQMVRTPAWSKERVIEQLLTRSLRNETLERRFVQPRALAEAASRLFGSWRAAVAAAGLDYKMISNMSSIQSADPINRSPETDGTTPEVSSVPDHLPGTHWTQMQVLTYVQQRLKRGAGITNHKNRHLST